MKTLLLLIKACAATALLALASGCGSSVQTFGDQVLVVFTEHAQSNYIVGAAREMSENDIDYIEGLIVKKGSNYAKKVKIPKEYMSGITVFDNVFDYERKSVGPSIYHPGQVAMVEDRDVAVIHVEGKMSSYRVRTLAVTNFAGMTCLTGIRFNRGFGEGKRVYMPTGNVATIQFFDSMSDYKKGLKSPQRRSIKDLFEEDR